MLPNVFEAPSFGLLSDRLIELMMWDRKRGAGQSKCVLKSGGASRSDRALAVGGAHVKSLLKHLFKKRRNLFNGRILRGHYYR